MRTGTAWFAALLSSILFTANASAVMNGATTIPVLDAGRAMCDDKNVQLCLDIGEGATGSVDAQADALIAPETFVPTCALTFTPVVKGGADALTFGWYNVQADPNDPTKTLKPTIAELYAMMRFTNAFQNNTQISATPPVTLDLVGEQLAGRYLGGEIAFFLANSGGTQMQIDPETHLMIGTPGKIYYTEHVFNPGSAGATTYYQVLTWQSAAIENAFYFGWEDQDAGAGSDNDFDDILFQVSGIQCSGGGDACETGLDGVCADGTMQCQRGALTCLPNLPPSAETCNALDDDCNGMVDEGDALCEADFVCDRGSCVPACSTGEFPCLDSQVCTDLGLCVDAACDQMECPAGQVCHAGECTEACAGVVCPYGKLCRNDACVDPCANITCEAGFACVMGICQSCDCGECQGGLVCQDSVCVDPACTDVPCEVGSHCEGGACVDDCLNAVCPSGTTCSAGECVVDGTGSGGMSSIGVDDGGIVIGSGATSNGGTDSDPSSDVGRRAVGDNKGCACEVIRRPSSSLLGPLLGVVALGLLQRRRRRAQN